jgi:hypothetical protein
MIGHYGDHHPDRDDGHDERRRPNDAGWLAALDAVLEPGAFPISELPTADQA